MKSRTRKWLKIGATIVAAIVIICVAAVLALRSQRFHRFVLAQMISRAEEATGGKVEIGDFTFHWSKLRLDIYRVVVHGTEPQSSPPLLSMDHAGLSIKIISLFEAQFELANLVVDHPVVHLSVDAAGQSNIPHPPKAKPGEKPLNVFSLAVRHFALNRGEIDYNNHQIPLAARLDDLNAKVVYSARPAAYSGSIAYHTGMVKIGDFLPVLHRLTASFRATEMGITVSPLEISTAHSRLSVNASVTNGRKPEIEGSFAARLSVPEVAHWLKESDWPSGDVSSSGSFSFQSAAGRSVLDSVSLEGRASSPKLSVLNQSIRAHVTDFSTNYRLRSGDFEATDFQARAFGGRVSGQLSLLHFTTHPQGRLSLRANSVSLSQLQESLPSEPLRGLLLQGEIAGDAKVTWKGQLADLHAELDSVISPAPSTPAAKSAAALVPLTGEIHLAYASGEIALKNTVLKTTGAEIDLNGTVGTDSLLHIQARTADLTQADTLATSVRQALTGSRSEPVRPLGLAGAASFRGTLQGSIQNPTVNGVLAVTDLKIKNAVLGSVQADLAVSPSVLVVRQGTLATGSSRVSFSGSVGLRDWSYAPSNPISVNLLTTALPLNEIENVANIQLPVSGLLSARLALRGSELQPAGEGSIEIKEVTAWDQPVNSVTANFHANGTTINATATAELAGGHATAVVTFAPKPRSYSGKVEIAGVRLENLEAVKRRKLPLTGVVTATAEGAGTLGLPELAAKLEIQPLILDGQSITGFSANAKLSGQTAKVAGECTFSAARITAGGTVQLSGDYATDLTFSTGLVGLRPFIGTLFPEAGEDENGAIELSGWLRGPLRAPQRLQAHVNVPTLRLSYQALTLANASPISADYRDGVLTLAPAELNGNGTDFHFEASVPVERTAALSASATGTIDLHILQLFDSQLSSSGQAVANLTVSGSRAQPDVKGQIRIVNALMATPDSPVALDKLDAVINLNAERAEIQNLTAEAGGGSISARGFVSFRQGGQFSLGVTARGVRIRYPPGVREVADADLSITGSLRSALISGQVLINQLALTQSFDLAAFAAQFGEPAVPTASTSFTHRVKLNVALRSSQELGLHSAELSLRGAADLRVRGTLADPVILGRATLSGGQLFFNGRRYRIESGVVQFSNPVTTEPVVNLRVTTTVNQYALSVNFVGPFDRMRTTYTSDPPLPPIDILNLLLTGQTVEAPSTGLGAQSLVAQGIAGQFSNRVQKLVGVSSLTIDPQMGGHGTNPGARIAVQEQVTRRLFFTFSVDVTTTQDDVVQVEYQLSHRLSLQAVRDQSGGYSVEVKVHKSF